MLVLAKAASAMLMGEFRHVLPSTLSTYAEALENGHWRTSGWLTLRVSLRDVPAWIQFKRGLARAHAHYVATQQPGLDPTVEIQQSALSPRASWVLALIRAGWLRVGDLNGARVSSVAVHVKDGVQFTAVTGLDTKEWKKGPRLRGSLPQVVVRSDQLPSARPPGTSRLLMPKEVRVELLKVLKEAGYGDHSARIGGIERAKDRGVPSLLRMKKARHKSIQVHEAYGRRVFGAQEVRVAQAGL